MRFAQPLFRLVALAALFALFAPVSIACIDASGEVDPRPGSPDAGDSTPIPTTDGGVPEDAGGDAGVDADAAKPTCTSEGWCHTAVPDKQTLRSVWGDGQGTVWAVSAEGNVLRWDGTAWVQNHSAGVPLNAIWGSGPTDLWVGGGTPGTSSEEPIGTLLHGTGASSGTITWIPVAVPLTIRSIWGTSAPDVWASASRGDRVAAGDASYVLHYAGAGWETDAVSSAFPAHFERVWGTSPDDVWVSGRIPVNEWSSQGQVLHRRPDGAGGFEWSREQPTTEDPCYSEIFGFAVSPTATFLIGFTGDFSGDGYYHTGVSSDQGATFVWTEHRPGVTGFNDGALSTLWGTGPNDLWVAGRRGRLRHWDGAKWRVALVSLDDDMPEQRAIHAIWGTSSDDLWAVGADIALHKTPKQ